ncbi:MAG: nucleoside triphosphate pyrophosphohydrolase [Candidatus Saccharicenans sp.]|nr:nucleoside triphosphate pyrophosphohydrolase [Candidatus Saccharicenans sp.]
MRSSGQAGRRFQQLVEIIARLRSPDGCPWDRARTRQEIINYFLEEVYEAVEALSSEDDRAACEELGDVLMEVVFLSRFFEEEGKFSISDVLEGINRKMVDRHPHVFGLKKRMSAEEVKDNWQRNKLREKGRESALDGLPGSAPALLYAFLLGQRAAAHGFDWPDASSCLEKVREELGELENSLKTGKSDEMEEELGDLFFSLVNFSRLLGLNPEIILRKACSKFHQRFRELEKELKKQGLSLDESTLEELDCLWELVKKNKKKRKKKAGKKEKRN